MNLQGKSRKELLEIASQLGVELQNKRQKKAISDQILAHLTKEAPVKEETLLVEEKAKEPLAEVEELATTSSQEDIFRLGLDEEIEVQLLATCNIRIGSHRYAHSKNQRVRILRKHKQEFQLRGLLPWD